jgi:hypothetical protein
MSAIPVVHQLAGNWQAQRPAHDRQARRTDRSDAIRDARRPMDQEVWKR